MQFTCTVDINAPIYKVSTLFHDSAHFSKWQDGFVSHDHISGTPGRVGAVSRVKYNTGKHKVELQETITVLNLPHQISALYEHKHMVNTMVNSFTVIPANQTRLITTIEYTKFYGLVPKLMALFMPGVFKKQTQKWLDQFKIFAEKAA